MQARRVVEEQEPGGQLEGRVGGSTMIALSRRRKASAHLKANNLYVPRRLDILRQPVYEEGGTRRRQIRTT
jgi:hypothetical protein